MAELPLDFDGPWKEAIDQSLKLFLAFFHPELHESVHWERDYESLDGELQKLRPESETGIRWADRLVRVWLKGSGDESAILHAEVQCQRETDFAQRQHVYNYRAEDSYSQPIVSFAVLGDDDSNWRPSEYHFERWGCERLFRFRTVKLMDWRNRLAELETHKNPFALLTLAHLQAIATRNDHAERAIWKLRLLKALLGRGWDAFEFRHWYRFFDWLLPLPKDIEQKIWQEYVQFAQENHMPFVTTAEQIGMEKGREEGGLEALRRTIPMLLESKFGDAARTVFPIVQTVRKMSVLYDVCDALQRPGITLSEIVNILS